MDLKKRLDEHNRGKTKFSAAGAPWILVFSKDFESRTDAILLESKIKNRGAARFLIDNQISVG